MKSILVRGSEGSSYRESTVIKSTKKTGEEMWREASAITGIGDHWGIPLLFGVCTDQALFYLVLQFHSLRSESVTLFKAALEKIIQDVAMCANILKQTKCSAMKELSCATI